MGESMNSRQWRRLVACAGGLSLALAAPLSVTGAASPALTGVTMHPAVSDYTQLNSSETPPTNAQCMSVGRTCFGPDATRASYNLKPLYDQGLDGRGQTIAIIDSFGSDTITHDLHVYNDAFGLQHMCGEEGVTCSAGMPTFSVLHVQGSPATKAPPPTSKGTGQEDRAAWALEVSLDVETAHSIAPMANIILVTTPTAETLGVQGLPDMMNAEQYVVDNHLATVISQSFGKAEDAFNGTNSLLNLRHAYESAAANGVTVLASSGDGGTANGKKSPVGKGGTGFPFPTVGYPASDPLVTGIGGTYLCTDPANTTTRTVLSPNVAPRCNANPTQAEVGWTFSGGGFSHVFGKPSYQNTLPGGSTSIGNMRGVPDVAFQASAGTGALVYLTLPPDGQSGLLCGSSPCSTGWYDIGGTSLGTPQWAGLAAIGAQLKGRGLGPINGALYTIASNPAKYAADFYDVATNNTNQADPSVPGYPATTGWDPVTGLGTPNAARLIQDLVALTP